MLDRRRIASSSARAKSEVRSDAASTKGTPNLWGRDLSNQIPVTCGPVDSLQKTARENIMQSVRNGTDIFLPGAYDDLVSEQKSSTSLLSVRPNRLVMNLSRLF